MVSPQLIGGLLVRSYEVMSRVSHDALGTTRLETVATVVPHELSWVVFALGEENLKPSVAVRLEHPIGIDFVSLTLWFIGQKLCLGFLGLRRDRLVHALSKLCGKNLIVRLRRCFGFECFILIKGPISGVICGALSIDAW